MLVHVVSKPFTYSEISLWLQNIIVILMEYSKVSTSYIDREKWSWLCYNVKYVRLNLYRKRSGRLHDVDHDDFGWAKEVTMHITRHQVNIQIVYICTRRIHQNLQLNLVHCDFGNEAIWLSHPSGNINVLALSLTSLLQGR